MKPLFYIFLLFFMNMNLISQNTNSHQINFWDNVQFGGGINLNFSNNYTILGITPSAIYNFSDKFATGVSISYLYVKNRNVIDPLNIFSTSVLARYQPLKTIQFSTEFEENFLTQAGKNETIPALYLGAGYNMNRNISVGIRYDLLYNENKSIFPSAITPFFKVFF